MNLFFWRKEPQTESAGYAPYEEIESKKTSTLGYFFLVVMVITGIWQGQNLLSAIQQQIANPQPNSYCTMAALSRISSGQDTGKNAFGQTGFSAYVRYPAYGYSGSVDPEQCKSSYSQRETRLGIDTIFEALSADFTKSKKLQEQISAIERQINDLRYNNRQSLDQYSVGLLEKIANEKGIVPTNSVKQSITTNEEAINAFSLELSNLNKEKEKIEAGIDETLGEHTKQFQAAADEYRREVLVTEFERFLLAAVLIFPLCYLVLRKYFSSKKNRSEYVIIWGGLAAIVSILAAQVLGVLVYRIIPYELLQQIWNFLRQFEFIFITLYWLGFILVPLFFGFLIYVIQKKFYNKNAVMMRAFKNEKCPGCSNKINPWMTFCPICGFTLKRTCHSCNNLTMNGASFCQVCGNKEVTPNN